MGRVKNVHIKLLAGELLEKFPDKFSKDFYKNKGDLNDLVTIKSKKMKNQIAGYLSRMFRKKETLKTIKVSFQPIVKPLERPMRGRNERQMRGRKRR